MNEEVIPAKHRPADSEYLVTLDNENKRIIFQAHVGDTHFISLSQLKGFVSHLENGTDYGFTSRTDEGPVGIKDEGQL